MNARKGFHLKMVRLPSMTIALFLSVVAVIFAGCAAGIKVAPKLVEPILFKGPSVERLSDGRQGFVIHDNPITNAKTHEEFDRAVSLLNDGKNEKAIELLARVIEKSPTVTAPHIDIAVAYLRIGQTGSAEEHLKAALALFPGHPVASNEYGLLLRRSGRFKEAREVYQTAISRFPEYLPVHKNLGILLDLYMDDPKDALHEFETCIASEPTDTEVGDWIAELTTRLKR